MGDRFYLFEVTDLWMTGLNVIAEQANCGRKGPNICSPVPAGRAKYRPG